MSGERRGHWQRVYEEKAPTEVSWHQAVPTRSLALIRAAAPARDAAVLDVGAGASTLVDHLLREGFTDVTALDVAASAFAAARARLGADAARVRWIVADVTAWEPERRYALWHDRAVFHFLVDPALRARYLDVLAAALAPGGHVVIATFGPDGPERCSGLPVQRYSTAALGDVLGPSYCLVRAATEAHVTPAGRTQHFQYGLWRVADDACAGGGRDGSAMA